MLYSEELGEKKKSLINLATMTNREAVGMKQIDPWIRGLDTTFKEDETWRESLSGHGCSLFGVFF